MATTLVVKVAGKEIHLKQNPHSRFIGSYIWDASFVMSKYLETRPPEEIVGKKFIEVGSGLGLVGIVVGLLNGDITLTDIPDVIDLLKHNVKQNLGDTGKVMELTWGDPKSDIVIETLKSPPPDFILAADCIYSEAPIQDLAHTLFKLSGPSTIVLVCSELRNKDAMETFLKTADLYFNREMVDYEIPLTSENYIQFWRLTLK
eukprot:TRINITY_DN844_c0_g2_i1.p1 TRINITY_DN844_c0_g2~~TRINITY_DN844_c0_g2_i1.p1  ORF type:complete len:203 (-),score=37.58 TRINITY_DN844_c0_g2_i1:74-682(-)